jgi:hypothetical protein
MDIINVKFKGLMDSYIKEYYKVEFDKSRGWGKLKDEFDKLINENGFEDEVKKCYILCELNDSNRMVLSREEWDYVGSFIGVDWSEGGFKDELKDLGL